MNARDRLARALRIPRMRAIRGAITVDRDDREEIGAAVHELLGAIRDGNGFTSDEVVSAIFTVTPDLASAFPAEAARAAGWNDVPLLCSSEIAVPGSLPRCVRVLLHVERHWSTPPRHVYLRAAVALRPDLPVG
jgi:chorismate mutase